MRQFVAGAEEGVIAKPISPWIFPGMLAAARAFLLLGFWLGWMRLYGEVAGSVMTVGVVDEAWLQRQIETRQRSNGDLEAAIGKLRQSLEGDVCTAESPLGPPG